MVTRQDQIIALIRTGVPALVGAFLAFLVARIPAVATGIAWVNEQLVAWGFAGVSVQVVLSAVVVAAVIALYYWLARMIGARWPAAEKWLLGHSSTPIYKLPAVPIVTGIASGNVTNPTTAPSGEPGPSAADTTSIIPGPPPERPSGA